MVELKNKYKIGVRRFSGVNCVGFFGLWEKECSRFCVVWQQTILSPLVSAGLFLLVLYLAIGNERGEVLNTPFMTFLAPGLICMQICTQAFSHSSSSFMIGKMQNILVDTIMAPLSAAEITLAIILASVTRAVVIAIVCIGFFSFFIDLTINNFLLLIFFTLIGSFILGALTVIISKDQTWLHKAVPFELSWHMQHLFSIGFCGGFTTFSSFAFETFALIKSHQWLFTFINVLANFSATLIFVWMGYVLCEKWT